MMQSPPGNGINCEPPRTDVTISSNAEKETSNDSNDMSKQEEAQPLSKRALKRKARTQQYRQLKKQWKAENLKQTGQEQQAGYDLEAFNETSYYFENGLRKVYPYPFVFCTHAKGRWVRRTLRNVLEKEFGFNKPEDVDKAFFEGKIHVNNARVSIDYVVKDCDYISHEIHRHENPVTDHALEILADTKDVVVINKPSSIPCHPCGRYRYNSVVFILGREMGYTHLRNIYRLDRMTSGVLVMGKTADATKKLEDQVLNRQVQKEYVCRVMGEFPSNTVTVDQPLQALSNKLRLQVVSTSGKSSQTTFTRMSYNGRSSVVKCVPHTGRTHQIRVHLQYLGYPIMNDIFYNNDAWGPNKGKDGVYEISTDDVCERILRVHHATQWEGGENPLFHKKLEEMTQENASDKSQDPISVNKDNDNSSTETASLINPRDITPSLSPNDDIEGIKSPGQVSSVSPQQSEDVCNKDTSLVTGSSTSKIESSSATLSCQPAFEWEKWHVEASCDMCKKTMIDPKPKDLVMFLHAWTYKGPGWEYEAKLPDWAQDDWHDEDEFLLDSTTQQLDL